MAIERNSPFIMVVILQHYLLCVHSVNCCFQLKSVRFYAHQSQHSHTSAVLIPGRWTIRGASPLPIIYDQKEGRDAYEDGEIGERHKWIFHNCIHYILVCQLPCSPPPPSPPPPSINHMSTPALATLTTRYSPFVAQSALRNYRTISRY